MNLPCDPTHFIYDPHPIQLGFKLLQWKIQTQASVLLSWHWYFFQCYRVDAVSASVHQDCRLRVGCNYLVDEISSRVTGIYGLGASTCARTRSNPKRQLIDTIKSTCG